MNATTVGAFGLAFSCVVVGYVGSFPPEGIGNLTATAILGWYAWHTAARVIPNLVADFRQEVSAQRQEYERERQTYRMEMMAEREERHADNQQLATALHELSLRLAHWDVTEEGSI